jgi:hypothetical protein
MLNRSSACTKLVENIDFDVPNRSTPSTKWLSHITIHRLRTPLSQPEALGMTEGLGPAHMNQQGTCVPSLDAQ